MCKTIQLHRHMFNIIIFCCCMLHAYLVMKYAAARYRQDRTVVQHNTSDVCTGGIKTTKVYGTRKVSWEHVVFAFLSLQSYVHVHHFPSPKGPPNFIRKLYKGPGL